MVEELSHRLPSFDGEASRVRCFAHIINLVAKSVISQFDTPKKKEQSGNRGSRDAAGGENDSDLQKLMAEITDLAGDHEEDELDELDEVLPEDGDRDRSASDGWIDERRSMLSEELKALERDVLPARRMLVKVCIFVGPRRSRLGYLLLVHVCVRLCTDAAGRRV